MRSALLVFVLFFSGLAQAQFTYKSSVYGMDGVQSYNFPMVVVDGVPYAIAAANSNQLCQYFGAEFSVGMEVKRALWGTYDAVDVNHEGEISAPKRAVEIVSYLRCSWSAASLHGIQNHPNLFPFLIH